MEEYLQDEQIKSFVYDYLMHFSLIKNKPFAGPEFLQFIITNKCPLKCKMCDVWKMNPTNNELTTEEVKEGIDQAIDLDKKIGGLREIYFTGGEALLRSDIFELIEYANSKKKISTLNTNGIPITESIARKIVKSQLYSLTFSIDGPNAEIHDFFRGKGVFEKAEKSINLMCKIKKELNSDLPKLNILTVIMKQNVDYLSDMIEFALSHQMSAIDFQPYTNNQCLSDEIKDDFWIPKEKLSTLKKHLKKIKRLDYELNKKIYTFHIGLFSDKVYNYFKKRSYADNCYAGFLRLITYQNRISFVCNGPEWHSINHLGLCPEDKIDLLWFSDRATAFRKNIKKCQKSCVQFCSSRPGSDSFFGVHKRFISLLDKDALKKESKFLKKYVFKLDVSSTFKIFLVLLTNPFLAVLFSKLGTVKKPRNLEFEPRINKLRERVCVNDLTVLELGCFEGAHSHALQMWGAKKVVAIEGRRENFLKSLDTKNKYKLDKCEFLFGDVSAVLKSLSTHFDLCLAMGILYHLRNPVSLIYRIGELSDKLFVCSHYATKRYPRGPINKIEQNGHVYRGKYMNEDTENLVGSLQKRVFWLLEDDLFALVHDAGFTDIELIQKERHEHGPLVTFFAQKHNKNKL